MKSSKKCSKCNGTGNKMKEALSVVMAKDFCKTCEGYGYLNLRKRKGMTLESGQMFYFLGVMENEPQKVPKNEMLELNGAGFMFIGDAESFEPSFDRRSNFFFTKAEAKEALQKIAKIIKEAK